MSKRKPPKDKPFDFEEILRKVTSCLEECLTIGKAIEVTDKRLQAGLGGMVMMTKNQSDLLANLQTLISNSEKVREHRHEVMMAKLEEMLAAHRAAYELLITLRAPTLTPAIPAPLPFVPGPEGPQCEHAQWKDTQERTWRQCTKRQNHPGAHLGDDGMAWGDRSPYRTTMREIRASRPVKGP